MPSTYWIHRNLSDVNSSMLVLCIAGAVAACAAALLYMADANVRVNTSMGSLAAAQAPR